METASFGKFPVTVVEDKEHLTPLLNDFPLEVISITIAHVSLARVSQLSKPDFKG